PDGQQIHYVYDANGRLSQVVSTTRGTLDSYGYRDDNGVLSIAARNPGGVAFTPGSPTQVLTLAANLGDAQQFDGHPAGGNMAPGGEDDYAFSLSDAEIRSTNAGTVILRVAVERNASLFVAATPQIDGLQPLARYVDGDRTVALFEVTHAGTYLLR